MFCIDIAGFLKNDYQHIFVKIACKTTNWSDSEIFFGYTLHWQRGVIKF